MKTYVNSTLLQGLWYNKCKNILNYYSKFQYFFKPLYSQLVNDQPKNKKKIAH